MARSRSKGAAKTGEAEGERAIDSTGAFSPASPPISYSARFDDSQRKLLEKAASRQGQSVAQFIRLASLERAAHVLNTGSPTQFDFYGIAGLLAKQMVNPTVSHIDPDGGIHDRNPYDREEEFEAVASCLSRAEIEQLTRAFELGGAEFWKLVSTTCLMRLSPDSSGLPEPIDPKQLTQGS